MTTQPLVFIDGDQGTTGLQIHQRLHGRTDLQVLTLPESDRKNPTRRAEAINSCDIAILCLPDAAAREAVAAIHNPAVRVIDASSAHRTDAQWVYGFPEMDAAQAARIASAQRVSNPGCYPTGAIARLRPLVQACLLPAACCLPTKRSTSMRCRATPAADAPARKRTKAPRQPMRPPSKSMGCRWNTNTRPRSRSTPGCHSGRFFCPRTEPSARASC